MEKKRTKSRSCVSKDQKEHITKNCFHFNKYNDKFNCSCCNPSFICSTFTAAYRHIESINLISLSNNESNFQFFSKIISEGI